MKIAPESLEGLRGILDQIQAAGQLRLVDFEQFPGPSPASPQPTMACTFTLTQPTLTAEALAGRIGALFPALPTAVAAAWRSGPACAADVALIIARLAAGLSSAAHDMEFACGVGGDGNGGQATGWIEYVAPAPAIHALVLSLLAVASQLGESPRAAALLGERHQLFDRLCARDGPNFEAAVLINAARKRDIPYLPVAGNRALWQFGWGKRSELFWVTSTNADGLVANRLSGEKEVAKRLLRQLGIPTPASRVIGADQDYRKAAAEIGWPCAVKPLRGGAGRGVSADVRDPEGLDRAVAAARKQFHLILIEKHLAGEDYRLMVIDGRLEVAVRRERPTLIGDGRRTVAALLAEHNLSRAGSSRTRRYLSPVPDDAVLASTLASQGVSRDTVVPDGKTILLRTNANRSTGATCTDVLDQVHPQIRMMAERAATAFGYRATGLDYVTTDISRSHAEVGGGFIELNSTPGIYVLLAAGVTEDRIGALILGAKPGRIPVGLILAPADAQQRLAALAKEQLAPGDALAAADCARIGALDLPAEELDAIGRVEALLRYPAVGKLIILWTLEDLLHFGMPVDRVDDLILLGTRPSEPWIALLERNAKRVKIAENEADAIAACFGGGASSNRSVRRTRARR